MIVARLGHDEDGVKCVRTLSIGLKSEHPWDVGKDFQNRFKGPDTDVYLSSARKR